MIVSEIYELYTQHLLVDTDTRNIRKNTMFFALKGANFNGNKFAEEALKKGASYAIVDEEAYQTNDKIILVDDVLKCLQELATYHRQQLNIPIVSLTGSNGKTTTKELINAVLSTKFKTLATKGNLNNHIGLPLTLLSMTPETEFGIVEMGANHKKEIEFLSNIAQPNFGYITNFGKAHLEGFGSVEGVIQGKSELYDYLRANNGKVFLNTDDDIQVKQSTGIHTIPFENSLSFIDANPNVKLTYQNLEIESQLIGSYNYNNIAAAVTIGNYLNIDKHTIKKAIENYVSTNNRSQVIEKNDTKIILDAYNANPSSMKAAIDNIDKIDSEKPKIVIIGDMFELGDTAIEEHQKLVDYIENTSIEKCIIVGNLFFQTESSFAVKHKDFEAFSKALNSDELKKSILLIKGSRGMALERTLELL